MRHIAEKSKSVMPMSVRCVKVLSLLLLIALPGSCADSEYYRRQLAGSTGFVTDDREFLLCALPQPLGDPLDLGPDGNPADVAFMDFVPDEQYVWSPSRYHVSTVYSSIFNNYRLGFRPVAAEEQNKYRNAMSRLYKPADPALILRGQLPALRLSARALDYFIKNELTLKRILDGDLPGVGAGGLIDAVASAGPDGEIKEALRVVREFQRNDVEISWSVRASRLESEVFPVVVNPSRATWNDESGWASILIPSPTNPALAISLQVKKVTVERPWLDESVFEQRNWYNPDDAGFVMMFSTGESLAALNGRPSGSRMLLLPSQFLLARKIEKIGKWTVKDEQSLPLCLKPSIDDPSVGSRPVVIAVICKRVPKSPRPDPTLEWPSGPPEQSK